ncbi:putative Acyl-coenzyme A:6-aminopenicillanic acid acyl-transferase-domain-containing protein [Seiridium cardinale]
MLEVRCSGSSYEIGETHGRVAASQIRGSIAFYTKLFQKSCSMDWPDVLHEAEQYIEHLESLAPLYVEEIRGIAAGAGLGFLDILALNVRTEINFGLFTGDSAAGKKARVDDIPSDGCTALAWLTAEGQGQEGKSWLCQNWDWMVEQGENLIVCYISQPGTGIPDIAMVTEAGIIGKIGLNSSGVGCCLNAIRCRGVDRTKLPIHFALRTVLESQSRDEAVKRIETAGVAGSGHILVADPAGSVGLECTSKWVKELAMSSSGQICHTNHLLLPHDDVDEPAWLADSPQRLARIRELVSDIEKPTASAIADIFKDVDGYPSSINRKQIEGTLSQTLFNIVMDLSSRTAKVTFGRPTEFKELTVIAF